LLKVYQQIFQLWFVLDMVGQQSLVVIYNLKMDMPEAGI
jgi:hypothetical protein